MTAAPPKNDFVCGQRQASLEQYPDIARPDNPYIPITLFFDDVAHELIRLQIPPGLENRRVYVYFRAFSVETTYEQYDAPHMLFLGKLQFFHNGNEVASLPLSQSNPFVSGIAVSDRPEGVQLSVFADAIVSADNYRFVPTSKNTLTLSVDNSKAYFNLLWNNLHLYGGSDFNLRGHESQTVTVSARPVKFVADTAVLTVTKRQRCRAYRVFLGVQSN